MSSFIAKYKCKRHLLWLPALLMLLLLLVFVNNLLQTFWAHRAPVFSPDYALADLSPLLAQPGLTDEDYATIFLQTGLSRQAVDQLLPFGEGAIDQILATQAGFFSQPHIDCVTLLPGRFTCEDRIVNEDGAREAAVPLALVEPGDIILSFSTHSVGWRHGHAGLVVDSAKGLILEAVSLGSNSYVQDIAHWRTYSNFIVLRVKGTTTKERAQVAQFAMEHLDGIPYSLTSGIFGAKAPDPEASLRSQCSYLPWYAWQTAGYDLDSDGGRIVTVGDLAESPLVEVIQVYGLNPKDFLSKMAS